MQQSILTKIKLFILRNRQNRIFRKCVQVLCCMVVFITTYALILPAITMEQDVFCGKEAHEHTEECLQPVPVPVLVCTPESLGIHTHSGSCYNADGAVICGQADYVVHSHGDSCYDAAGQLVCLFPERGSHVHGDSCYIPGETQPEIIHVHSEECYIREKGELTCTEEEREGHSHGDQCYGPGDLLECTLTEHHVHDDSCYSLPLTCSLSTEPHVHSEECYGTGILQCSTPEYHTHENSCWDSTLSCGKSEGGHQHSDSCWETIQVCEIMDETHAHGEGCTESRLICGLTEESHYHDESCYTANLRCQIPENHAHSGSCYESILVCGKEAGQVHEHNDSCYGTEPQLQCQMPENHVHDSGCYNLIQICELPEDPGHRHEDACYLWESVLNCGLEEGQPEPTEPPEPIFVCTEPDAPVHVHGNSCFELRENTCQGREDHQHTDSCYTCGLEEHEHTLICFSDPDADVESPEVWKATFAHVTLTGDWPTDVVAIAETQLGYTESTRNYAVWEDNSTHGYTRYGAWYGSPHGDWCGMFASFCLNYAEVKGMPHNYGVRPWIEELTELGLYYTAKETKAQKGNLIFFDWDADGLSDHVGIVAEVQEPQEHTGASVKTIEGNSGNAVRYRHYDPNDPVILGYGLLPGQEWIPVEEPSDEVLEDSTLNILICGTPGYVHGDSCYDEEGTLICEKQEHIHSISCVDPSSPIGHASAGQMLRMMSYGLSPRASGEVSDIRQLLQSIVIYDSQGNVVYNSADSSIGTGQVKLGENCKIKITFKENEQTQFPSDANDVLTYTIPSNLVSEVVGSGVIVDDETHSVVANYTIKNNQLTITPVVPAGEQTNFFGKYANADLTIEFDAEVLQTSGSEGTDIDFSDNFVVDIKVVDEGYLSTEKEFVSFDPDTREITYQCTVTAHGGRVEITRLEDYCWGIDANLISIDQNTLTLTDTQGNNVKDRWYVAISDENGIWIVPYENPYNLGHNESITMTYKVKIDDSVDFNFNYGNGFYVHGKNEKEELYDKKEITTPIRFTNVEKSGKLSTEELNGETVSVLEWTVVIENEALEKITMCDHLSAGQTFCTHKNIIVEAFKPDGTVEYFTLEWNDVKLTDNTSFEYTLPVGYSNYRMHYYSHYEFDQNGDAFQTFKNTVTTTVDGKDGSFDGTGSVGVLGVPPGITKTIPASDEDWIDFKIECFVPGALYNQPNVLLYDTLASWNGEYGYVQQHPDSLAVTITPEGGDPYALQPYSEGGSTENTYLLVEKGQTFDMYFNTSEPSTGTSVWKCNVDSTLTVTYRISLDSPMLDNWGGQPNGETLREFLERTDQKINNSAALTYSTKDEVSDSINWEPPRKPDPNLRKNATPDKDGVYNYSVWFDSVVNGTTSIFQPNSEIESFILKDVFDSRMEYVPGSLCVNIWTWQDHTKLESRLRLPEGQSPVITETDDGKKCMTVSADKLIAFEGNSYAIGYDLLTIINACRDYGYQYEFTYQLRVRDDIKNTATEGILKLDNTAYINWTDSTGPRTVDPAQNHVNYETGILQKGMEEVEDRNLVNFSILVNHNELNLTGVENGRYVLYDTMTPNLTLMYNTLVVEVMSKGTDTVAQKLTLEECNFSFDPDKNQMIFNLPDEKVIRLTYSCRVNGISGETTQIGNVVELQGRSTIQDFVDTEFQIKEHQGSASGSSTSMKFHLQKQDGNNHNTLAGVTFDLYGEVKGDSERTLITADGKTLYYYKSYTTGSDGIALIEHSLLAPGFLYALEEDSPPSGYVALSEPFVFYMENPPEGMTTDIDIVFNDAIQVVKNYPMGYELPSTGGTGYELYTVGGMLLIWAAVILLYNQKKCRKEDMFSS